mgnify:CR=1 FL=1|tara:strand:+ start:2618 stop:3028 length:411 start_codon:yes stop_codon:yes gene_type:complete
MGNRAIIRFQDTSGLPEIYLHWNGGRASVQAFLNVAKKLEIRADDYGVARLCQIIGNFMGGNLSLGCRNSSSGFSYSEDNGIYIIKNFEIIGREGLRYEKEEENEEKTKLMTDFILDLYKKLEEGREELEKLDKYK